MTRFPLRSLRLRSGEELRERLPVALEPFALGGQRYLPVPDRADAELTIQRATSGDVFRLAFTARLHGPCMRCLEDAAVDLAIDAHEYQDARPGGDENLASEYVLDDQLDLSAWARDAIALALPDQILCRSGCAGLCALCGRNLNDDPHEHPAETRDARWTALEALRDEL